ncbi:kinase-like protein, partial [Patellaria atrata CBS 101060]
MNSLSVPSTTTGHRVRQVQAAKEWQDFVEEKATRTGSDPPPYEFLELIGKGSFGRVYKAKDRNTQNIVAVKVVEIDDQDYRERPHTKDENIKSFFKEINVLQQLKESKAKNINIIYDAFSVHSYLWLVSEYCPGGSVHTLMKPCTKGIGLEERFIIPIARELAIALKTVHEAGVLHRDVKCANILVTEDGRVQLCDFGVAAVLESNAAKRTTVLGTPHWSPPEMVSAMKNQGEKALPYGAEFDCWAFGCTVYELATGLPPNSNLDIFRLPITLRRAPPRLQGDQYSPGLRDFVAFCLELRPEDRPTAAEILAHPYITNTSEHYPTDSLTELIERYAKWEQEGGHRASLFNPFGAQAPVTGQDAQLPWTEDDEWNFSYTEQFARE